MQKITIREKTIWAMLAAVDGPIGAASLRGLQLWLVANRMSVEEFWAEWRRLAPLAGWKGKKLGALEEFAGKWTVESFTQYLAEREIGIVWVGDEEYPPLLRYTPDLAPVLFYQGDLSVLSRPTLAVVGARQVTDYGRLVIEELLTDDLAGATIVSGMMVGVDELAHRRALSLGMGTAAYLGYGLEHVWPEAVADLKLQIRKHGVLLSEFAPWLEPLTRRFPMRNRLVAGSSIATLVVEAAAKSGTQITAGMALDYGREVMAVPGSIFNEKSIGCLELIKKGAIPVTRPGEIVRVLSESSLKQADMETGVVEKAKKEAATVLARRKKFADEWQQKAYDRIMVRPIETEELCEACGEQEKVLTALSMLELLGEIEKMDDGRWRARGGV